MTTYAMSLRPAPFGQIQTGRKTIEVRLYDEKRRQLAPDDRIIFTNTETGEEVAVRVVGLLRYGSFVDLFSYQSPAACGFDEVTAHEAAAAMRTYYSAEEEQHYGVLGIELTVL